MIERAALGLLCAMARTLGYNTIEAAQRFGNASEAFDRLTPQFERGGRDVAFAINVVNPTDHPVEVRAFDYSFLANGVNVGGGKSRDTREIAPRSSQVFELTGLVIDVTYMARQPEDEPIEWRVPFTVLVSVDEELDPVWQMYSFRAETP